MNELINLLTDEEKRKYVEKKEYNKNDVIFSEGLLCKYIGIIEVGKIMISTITYNNKEEVINLLNKDQLFGNNLIFSSSPYFLGDIISLTNSKIYFINKINLLILFKNNERFLCKYLELISNQIIKEKSKTKILVHKNIRDRILYYITNESKRKGQVKIKSIADLARELSLPRPSVSREIYKLINENIISYNNKILTII